MDHRLKHPTFVKGLLAALKEPRTGAEIGVERGHFTEQMLGAFPRLHLFAVDPWQAEPPFGDWPMPEIKAEFYQRTHAYRERVTVYRMTSLEAAPKIPDQSLDFVFIDANHSYESVRDDIGAWRPKVRVGGLLMGHDFSPKYPGVRQAVTEVFPLAGVDTFSRVWWVGC